MKVTVLDKRLLDDLKELDKSVFPKHLWLAEEEQEFLLSVETRVAVLYSDTDRENPVAVAYYLSSTAVADLLSEYDEEFQADARKIYVYSVAVLEKFRRVGLGRRLREALMQDALVHGYVRGSTHTRMNGIANVAAKKVYHPTSERLVEDFYGDGEHALYMEFALPG